MRIWCKIIFAYITTENFPELMKVSFEKPNKSNKANKKALIPNHASVRLQNSKEKEKSWKQIIEKKITF